ncbi:MAG: hypothetical protein ACC634_00075 [Hyphomicrobiales bacterium]
MDALVGHTGFVGGNLARQHGFAGLFNSTNIADIKGAQFETLVCSAVPATMWLANSNPDADRTNILALFERLRQVQVDRFVLISTSAVYRDVSCPVDETSNDFETELAYGSHRRELEYLVTEHFPGALIARLPALFGAGLKKNFLFDILNPVPSFLKPEVFDAVLAGATDRQKQFVERAFSMDETTGMWRFERAEHDHGAGGAELAEIFEAASASALQFTHADSMFQFYGLHRLWQDILCAMDAGIGVLNLATEPIRAGDIFQMLKTREMTARSAPKVLQDMRSCHAGLWAREDGYLYGQEATLAALKAFIATGGGQRV